MKILRSGAFDNPKAPAEHVTPASRDRVQQAGRTVNGNQVTCRFNLPPFTPPLLFVVACLIVSSASEFLQVIREGRS